MRACVQDENLAGYRLSCVWLNSTNMPPPQTRRRRHLRLLRRGRGALLGCQLHGKLVLRLLPWEPAARDGQSTPQLLERRRRKAVERRLHAGAEVQMRSVHRFACACASTTRLQARVVVRLCCTQRLHNCLAKRSRILKRQITLRNSACVRRGVSGGATRTRAHTPGHAESA